MHFSSLHYFPLAWPYFLALAGLLCIVFGFVAAGVLTFASASLGIGSWTMLLLMLLSLIGSYINIPIAYLPGHLTTFNAMVTYFGVEYVIPLHQEWPGTMLAVNFGGAVIPIMLSMYLIGKNRILGRSMVGIAVVASVCHLIAQPVPGLGIVEPTFVPPVATAITAFVLSRRQAAPLAYISGTLGTLIGADLLNIGKIQGIGAPIASIGGAGTFDGIFVTGLLALVYAGVMAQLAARHNHRASERRG